jgi:plastocyanin
MVFFTSLIGAAAILAGAASAVPMDYSPPSSGNYGSYSPPSGSYSNSYGNSGSYGNSEYGSGNYDSGSSSSSSSTWSMTTSTAAPMSTQTYNTPSYGSGSSSWSNGGDYNNCVQQCMNQYGSPATMNIPPASTPTSGYSNSGSGNGATHTVIVAPTQGVLRYVPFVVNASVGDTVMFMWGANNHTVTKSSQLELCNKTSDAPFASGEQNKSFMFSQVVNDTSPTFYYCGTPTHCEKGMFGIINPPNAYQQPSSLAAMMPMLTSQNPSTNASWAYTSNYTANNSAVANWAMDLDMSKMPTWAASYVAENVMYSQNFLAANPGTLSSDGTVSLSGLSNGTMTVPADIAAAARQNNAGSTTPSYSSPAASGASPSPSATGSPSGALKNGAGALASPRIVVALVAVAAAAFAL